MVKRYGLDELRSFRPEQGYEYCRVSTEYSASGQDVIFQRARYFDADGLIQSYGEALPQSRDGWELYITNQYREYNTSIYRRAKPADQDAVQFPAYIVDVFCTDEAYTGNQLAVLRGSTDNATMQRIALEMNYSETTFITDDRPANGGYAVRIFTAADELPFAGHPTLGTAFIIRRELIGEPVEKVVLSLKAGHIPVTFREDGTLWMQQNPPVFSRTYDAEATAAVLGLPPEAVDTRFPPQVVSTGIPFMLLPLTSRATVERARMDPNAWRRLIADEPLPGLNGILFFAPEPLNAENDLHARMLWHDDLGTWEDAATGSANGTLAAWLVKHRYFGTPQINARVEQGYPIRRPSLLMLEANEQTNGDGDATIRVRVGGRVRLVLRGALVDVPSAP